MQAVKTIGLDIAKSGFQVHGVDADGQQRDHCAPTLLGFEVAQSTVARYMVKRHGLPSQGWRTFLRNHAPDIAPWTCLLCRALASTCSIPSSSLVWAGDT
jgi:hypothetical protein